MTPDSLPVCIRHRRTLLGLTRNDLARRAGVDRSTISRIERARQMPTLLTIEALAAALSTTPAELLSQIL